MSSSLIVEVSEIREIKEHPNADTLEICVIKGWESIVRKGSYKVGDLVVYIPVDSVLPVELADRFNVRNYLKGKKNDRVGCAKLRGVMSYGLVVDNEEGWEADADVKDHYGITKYEPPIRISAGDAAPDDQLFDKFTDIENIRNFPDVFEEGEMVVVSEKIDGTCDRVGWSIDEESLVCDDMSVEWKAGSHKIKRVKPSEEGMTKNTYWYPHTIPGVKNLLTHILESSKAKRVATLYGEVYGKVRGGHKSMHYGKQNSLNFAAFGLKIDGVYVDWEVFSNLCKEFDVPMVPVIDVIPFNMDKIKELSKGKSILAKMNGTDHIREGVVVCPIKERDIFSVGRVILKVINPDYLLMKNKREAKGENVDFTDA
jgi:RNA ligase (TIGR02306 family)